MGTLLMDVLGSRLCERALELGKAEEHLVCADLILAGYRAFLSDQGLPYDIVVDLSGRPVRIQAKGCCAPTNVNASGRNPRMCYSFSVRRRGKDGSKRLSIEHCDVIAAVALDIRAVAYFPLDRVGQTLQLLPPGYARKPSRYRVRWAAAIDQYPFAAAIEGLELRLEES
jgi:hypothetical protein